MDAEGGALAVLSTMQLPCLHMKQSGEAANTQNPDSKQFTVPNAAATSVRGKSSRSQEITWRSPLSCELVRFCCTFRDRPRL